MKKILLGLGLLLVVAGVGYLASCPCGNVPGAWLFGTEPASPVNDWSFVNDRDSVPLCQIEVTSWRPHSINLNCMAEGGELFLSCSRCAGKYWSDTALSNPAGRIRAAGTVYPVSFERITEASLLDRVWLARLNKIGAQPSPRPDHWWSFRLRSR